MQHALHSTDIDSLPSRDSIESLYTLHLEIKMYILNFTPSMTNLETKTQVSRIPSMPFTFWSKWYHDFCIPWGGFCASSWTQ